MTGSKKVGILAHKPNKDLSYIRELVETGEVKPVIDRQYPFSEAAEAFRYFVEGKARVKVIISLEESIK